MQNWRSFWSPKRLSVGEYSAQFQCNNEVPLKTKHLNYLVLDKQRFTFIQSKLVESILSWGFSCFLQEQSLKRILVRTRTSQAQHYQQFQTNLRHPRPRSPLKHRSQFICTVIIIDIPRCRSKLPRFGGGVSSNHKFRWCALKQHSIKLHRCLHGPKSLCSGTMSTTGRCTNWRGGGRRWQWRWRRWTTICVQSWMRWSHDWHPKRKKYEKRTSLSTYCTKCFEADWLVKPRTNIPLLNVYFPVGIKNGRCGKSAIQMQKIVPVTRRD